MTQPRFIHLRVHSDYSMIDGLAKIEMLVKKAVSIRMPALAITDFTNLCGLIKFYITAHKAGIKPIIGADFYVQDPLFPNSLTQISILAMNDIGYHNLILLISKAYQRGYGDQGPWINREWLIELKDGLLLISGGRMGEIGKNLLRGNIELIDQSLTFYKKYFPDRFYLELIRTGRSDEEYYLNAAVELAEKKGLPVVATNDVRFLEADDFDAHEVRVAIQYGVTLDDPKRLRNYSPQQYMRSEEEMCKLFSDIPAALENSVEIAKRCNVRIQLGQHFLPQFPTGNMNTKDFLTMKSKEGLEERLEFLFPNEEERKKRRPEYDNRLDLELKVINQMGFPGYFLIVMEFINWSKKNGIPVGPGRGSGSGSLVAYSLKITDLNPLEFDLLFERFLNPERVSMPDFDIDFCTEKRDQVIEHVIDTYGRDAVSQIITFGTMAAKAAIRDVGRVLGHPYSFVHHITKLVPSDPGMTIEKAFEVAPKLLQAYKENEEVRLLINMAKKLEGVTRNAGKHAGGVVIAPTKITDFLPIYCDKEGLHPLTQFDKNDLEYVGLVKFDFLGLRTLTTINWSLEMINKRRKKNSEPPLNITELPLDDKKSFNMLSRAETTGVFQLESRGMKELIKRLQPDCFEDIIALVALFRPGPLQSGMVDNFINRKHGREIISYPEMKWQHEALKPVLKSTYGIILYQEQVMQIARVLSGYTLGGADMLRRAMGKKKPEEMERQRSIFQEGAKNNGIDGELAVKVFDLVEKFADYGFNKSHSAAYALISYQTLWLKAHYPAEFMSAVMTAEMDNTEKIFMLLEECYRMGLQILPPDINSGLYHFHVNDEGKIVYGIGAIKGVGEGTIEAIIQERKNGGHFHELFDLCVRIDPKKLNRRVLERLIMSGAFDKIGPHRAALIHSIDDVLRAAEQYSTEKKIGQTNMFGFFMDKPKSFDQFYAICQPWKEQELLAGEREALGFCLTGHPIDQYASEIERYVGGLKLKDVQLTEQGKLITVAGVLIGKKVLATKHGSRIAICTLDDRSGRLEVVFSTDILYKYQELLEKDHILIISGQTNIDDFNGRLKMSAREVMNIEEARKRHACRLSISLTDHQINDIFLSQFRQFLEAHCPGSIPVHLNYQRVDARVRLRFGEAWRVSPSDRLLHDLRRLIGIERVNLEFD